ncbi:acyltransferase family protein [Pedobacter cryoconitis]|uniref:acyltransferase family protein n=1 Tax=Pedobacter cryoconitis TaxID=188932 RepID=UPI00161D0D12|nr:acyltransferase [Pedobacter cryoconitis]MBB5645638.1 peptidoglycan/LPS O-acetylase OafA/YrhL [Pedobacter cryoconitis]
MKYILSGLNNCFSSKNDTIIPEIFADKKFNGIDGLRAVSIIIVFVGHFNVHYSHIDWLGTLLERGGLGVNFFFVISGFLITTLLLKENAVNGQINIKKFYIRRSLRIFPVAYLYLIFVFLLNYFLHLQIPTSFFLLAALYVSNTTYLMYQKDTVGNSVLLGHYWSLSTEEQFYLLYPFLFKYCRKYLVVIILTVLAGINFITFWTSHVYFFTAFHGILIGALFSFLCFRLQLKKRTLSYASVYQAVIIVLIFGINYLNLKYGALLICTLFAFFLIILLVNNSVNFFYRFLNNRLMVFIGILSYSIYIWQQIFIYPSGLNDKVPLTNNALIATVLSIAVGYLSYRYYESYFLKLKNRFG